MEDAPADGVLQRLFQDAVHVVDGAGREAALAVPPAGDEGLGVGAGDLLRPQLRQRCAAEQGHDAAFDIGSATELPWLDASMDISMLPFLLEHVVDWKQAVAEALRVLKPGGIVFISTTSKLCPLQDEFDLPAYGWYPPPLKRYF